MKHFITTLLLATAVTSFAAPATDRMPPTISKLTESELRVAYWDCDYMSTVGALGFGDATACSFIYERLLTTLPPGGFMAWWRANKDAEYAKRKPKDPS